MRKPFFTPEPVLIAHRGYSAGYPENTWLAFQKAIELQADLIETDVHLSSYGLYVISHDDSLDRVSDGTGKIADYTLEELKRFDAGYHFTPDGGETYPYRGKGLTFMSLEETLREFPKQRFNVDLKEKKPWHLQNYCDVIKRCDAADRVLTASEHTANLRSVRRLLPEIATSASVWEVLGIYFLFKTGFLFLKKSFIPDALQVPERIGPSLLADRSLIRQLHQRGMKMHVWTINTEPEMKRLIEAGVDGIMTDNLPLLIEAVKKYEKQNY